MGYGKSFFHTPCPPDILAPCPHTRVQHNMPVGVVSCIPPWPPIVSTPTVDLHAHIVMQAILAFLNSEPSAAAEPNSLGDLIMQKLSEGQQGFTDGKFNAAGQDEAPLEDKVVQVYKGVGRLLSRYAVGKVI
jgi:hypothetical protein